MQEIELPILAYLMSQIHGRGKNGMAYTDMQPNREGGVCSLTRKVFHFRDGDPNPETIRRIREQLERGDPVRLFRITPKTSSNGPMKGE